MPGSDLATYAQLRAEVKVEGARAAAQQLLDFKNQASAAEEATTKLERRLVTITKTVALLGTTFAAVQLTQFTAGAVRTAMEFEKLDVQMKAITGSARQADKATQWVKEFTRATPYQLQQTTGAFIRLKAFGLDPMDGTMQAVADSAAKLGASAETMGTVILALGKAWSRGKMEGEDFNMLLERGVPVTILLSKTLGLAEGQILQLREAGLLGREAITALIQAMEDTSKGASEAFMKTLPGALSNLMDSWAEAQNQFAREGGITRELIRTVQLIKGEIDKLIESEDFAKMGRTIAAAIRPLVTYLPVVYRQLASVLKILWANRDIAVGLAKIMVQLWVVNQIGKFLDYLNKVYLVMKSLYILSSSMNMAKMLGFTQAATEAGAMRQMLAGLSPALQTAGNAAITAANKVATFTLRIYAAQAGLMAAVLAAQALSMWLDRLNKRHLKPGTFEHGGSAAVIAQSEMVRGMAPERYQRFKEMAEPVGGDLTRVFQQMDAATRYAEREGIKVGEIVSNLGRKYSETFVEFAEEYAEALKKAKEELKKLADEEAKMDPMGEWEKELEELEDNMRTNFELGQKLLAQAQKDAEAKKLQEAATRALRQAEEELMRIKRQQLLAQYEYIEANFEGRHLQQEQLEMEASMMVTLAAATKKYNEEWERGQKDRFSKLKDEVGDLVSRFDSGFENVGNSFYDLLNVGMAGDLENFGALWDNVWQGLAKSMMALLGEAFTNFLEGKTEVKDSEGRVIGQALNIGELLTGRQRLTTSQSIAAGIGGLGMIYSGSQQGGTAGAVQGGLGGISTGLGIVGLAGMVGPWAPVVIAAAAIVGALAGSLGGKEDKPRTTYAISPTGQVTLETMGQGMTAREDRTAAQAIEGLYRSLADQWRGALRLFSDRDLFELVKDPVELALRTVADFTAQDLEVWLRESKLPTMFQHQYNRAIRRGLRDLGLSLAGINDVFETLRGMPGTERLEALQTVIQSLTIFEEMLALDFGALEDRLDLTAVDLYVESLEDVSHQMDMLTSGWDSMDLVTRASDLEQIGVLFQSITEATLNQLSALDDLAENLRRQFESLRQSFETRGMSDEELYGWYEQQYYRYRTLLEGTSDPEMIAYYAQILQDLLSGGAGLIPDETWLGAIPGSSQTFQGWFLEELARLESLSADAVQEQRDRIQTQFDLVYDQLVTIREAFEVLQPVVEDVKSPFEDLPPAIDPVIDDFRELHEALLPWITGGNGSSEKSIGLPMAINIEPPVVVVNVNGSLALLDARIDSILAQRSRVSRRKSLRVIS